MPVVADSDSQCSKSTADPRASCVDTECERQRCPGLQSRLGAAVVWLLLLGAAGCRAAGGGDAGTL
jgi:hypothetical protein